MPKIKKTKRQIIRRASVEGAVVHERPIGQYATLFKKKIELDAKLQALRERAQGGPVQVLGES